MKRLIIFLLTVLSLNLAYGQTRVDTVEAHRLFEEGRKLLYSYKFSESLMKFQKSGQEFKEQKQDLRYAKCLLYQLYCYQQFRTHNYKIISLSENALRLFWKERNYLAVAQIYSIMGNYYYDSGIDIDKALYYSQKSVSIYRKSTHKTSLNVAWLWNMIATISLTQRKYEKAFTYYEKSHKLLQKLLPTGDPRLGYYFENMSRYYRAKKKYGLAIKYLKRLDRNTKKREGYYINLGDLHFFQKKLLLSEQYYLKALQVAKKRYNGRHQNIGAIYGFLARLSIEKRDYLIALNFINKGLNHLRSSSIDTLDIYHQLAVEDSRSFFIYSTLLRHKSKVLSLLSNDLNNLKASLYNYQLYDSVGVRVQSQNLSNNAYLFQLVYANAIQVCQRLYTQTQGKKYQRLAFYFAQRSHANILAKSLQARRAKIMVHLPDSLISQEMYLKQQQAYYQQKILIVKDTSQQKTYQDSVFSVVRAQDKLSKVYAQKFPKYFRLRYQSKPITVEQLQQKLNKNVIVLSYVWGKEQSHVLAITHNDLNVYTLPPQAKITTALNAYYDALQQEQRLPNFAKKSYQAYQYLFAPVEKLLQGKQQVIVANPTLLSVPLEALVTQPYQPSWRSFGQLPYLVKKHSLSYHYSATLWWQSQGNAAASLTKKNLRFAAFAPFSGGKGKVMTTRANEGLLPESKAEVSTVYNFFKQKNYNAVAYLSKAATRREFLNQAAKSDILHIASHSTANLRETRLAKVHFAPQAQVDSTYLYAESIYHLPLKARLVVLSSCDSGVGKFVVGEGVESLARGFLHAGAQSVISSLWEADDAYTKKLMILFYDNALFHQNTYVTALSHAKRQLMRKEPQLHPKYWSCFILIGN